MSTFPLKKFSTSFYALTGAQFFGAFNDNMFKLLVIFQLVALYGTQKIVSVSAMAGAVFVIPFLLFSPFAGIIADRFSKRTIFHWLKIFEIGIMAIGSVGFITQSPLLLYSSLFLMSLQSALLGPAKTGLVPEIVEPAKLTQANSILVMSSFMAIITGTGAAALLSMVASSAYQIVSSACVLVAVAGTLCSSKIKQTDHAHTKQSSMRQYSEAFIAIKQSRPLLWSIIGSTLFLFIGAFVQLSIIPYGMTILSLSREGASYLFLFAALGIGAGALLAGSISRQRPEIGIIPIAAAGMACGAFMIHFWGTTVVGVSVIMTVLGFFGGMFIVPLQTLIQQCSPSDRRGTIIAINSTLDFTGILAASGVLWLLDWQKISIGNYFDVVVVLAMIITIASLLLVLRSTLRLVPVICIRLLYRLCINGKNSLPQKGGALLVFNHHSWIDALIAVAACPRPVRFLMARKLYDIWFLKPLMRVMNVIPVSYNDGPHALAQSILSAKNALLNGEVVGIFPEGKISLDGFMGRIKTGYRKIVHGTGVPVIPCYIQGIWGSNFSYFGGALFTTRIHLNRRKIVVRFGNPMNDFDEPWKVRRSIEQLGTCCAGEVIDEHDSLGEQFIKMARKNWNKKVIHDTTGKEMTYGNTLVGSLLIADYCKRSFRESSMIGVMLPATVGAALINVGITLAGKIPVNLNFTVSSDAFTSSVRQCGLRTIITSKQFLKKLARDDIYGPFIFVEDIIPLFKPVQKLYTLGRALFMPVDLLLGTRKVRKSSDCATVIFSSGTTAEPKGIVLSHKNILSNVDAMQNAIALKSKDRICAALPFFHSFGYTVTLWYPLLKGCAASYHTNPLEGTKIAQMVKEKNGTVLLATPTFLRSYIRQASRNDFSSLRLVITGAEKLGQSLADMFEEKFGIVPLEGYGVTELSPVVSLNIPDRVIDGVYNIGCHCGTIGRTLPGIAAKIVDKETGREKGYDAEGLLYIKGANVMCGYLNNKTATEKVLHDGWYNTGDIASIDQDGFITLKGRLSRFSKIGGEMVSHGAIEDAIQGATGIEERCVAVTAIPDEIKGERLVVVYTHDAGPEEKLRMIISESTFPNLWKPHIFVESDCIPMLGSGKLDCKELKSIAMNLVNEALSGRVAA